MFFFIKAIYDLKLSFSLLIQWNRKIHFNPYKLEKVDSRMDLHRRSQFIFYLQLERELLILDEQVWLIFSAISFLRSPKRSIELLICVNHLMNSIPNDPKTINVYLKTPGIMIFSLISFLDKNKKN